jgi:hypothetical protein
MLSVVLQNSDTLCHEEKLLVFLYHVGVQPDILQVSSQTSSACAQDV